MADLYFGDVRLVKDEPESNEPNYEHGVATRIGDCDYYFNLQQGSAEWFQMRLGIMTASEMRLFFTPKLARSNNEKSRSHVYELISQRIAGFIEEGFVGDHMIRGYEDEIRAGMLYEKHFAPVTTCGFIRTERYGFPLGYSPDYLVGDDGLIECKSRLPKLQVQTILNHMGEDPAEDTPIPPEFMIQIQTGLLITQRKWCDFLSYCGGLPMVRIRVFPDPDLQEQIVEVGEIIEATIRKHVDRYEATVTDNENAIPTERVVEQQMMV